MSRPPLLSPENFALYDRVWGEAVAVGDRRYWPALGRLMDAAREEGRRSATEWLPDPPKGDMFIWGRPNQGPRDGWAVGLGYWTVSGGWLDVSGANLRVRPTRFARMPEPPQ